MKTKVSLRYFVNDCRYQVGLETQMEDVMLYLIVLIFFVTNAFVCYIK